jgi:hypothetical protein
MLNLVETCSSTPSLIPSDQPSCPRTLTLGNLVENAQPVHDNPKQILSATINPSSKLNSQLDTINLECNEPMSIPFKADPILEKLTKEWKNHLKPALTITHRIQGNFKRERAWSNASAFLPVKRSPLSSPLLS